MRDSLRGERVGDWDVATAAHPEVVQSLFPVTFPIGVEHGTVGVRAEGETIEVTTFRTDVATDGRHAEVRFGATLEEDLERRDFTINAIAWDLENDTVIDSGSPIGGSRRIICASCARSGSPFGLVSRSNPRPSAPSSATPLASFTSRESGCGTSS